MEDEIKPKKNNSLSVSIMIGTLILAGIIIRPLAEITSSTLAAEVLPSGGIILPVRWGNLGSKMVEAGVIDMAKLDILYAGRGGINVEMFQLLNDQNNNQLKITPENAGVVLNLLWALGLGNKNEILETGPMSDPQYGGAGSFASTGGWTLATGDVMDHYGRHPFVVLTPEQQQLVERVSKSIYRPCCGNSTHFPGWNHGMAMLGLLELMAARGVSEAEMYKVALQVNAYWFPDTYLTIATYMASKDVDWRDVKPQEMLSHDYSSEGVRNGGGCGV